MHDDQAARARHLDAQLDVMAGTHLDAADERVLALVAHVVDALDPVPDGLVERATFAVALDEVFAEVARIRRSPVAADAALVRGPSAPTAGSITFTADDLTITMTVVDEGHDSVRIDGWVAPGGAFVVGLRLPGETRRTTVVEDGRFEFTLVPHGLVQLLVEPRGGTAGPRVVTPAVEL